MQRFSKLSRSRQIGTVVASFHLCLILGLFIHHFFTRTASVQNTIAIHTIAVLPPRAQAVCETKPVAKTASKQTPRPTVKANPKASPKTVSQRAPTQTTSISKEALLKQLSDSLETCSAPIENIASSVSVSIPSIIETTSSRSTHSQSYASACTSILQHSLDLPELGTVTAQIEINAQGNVAKVEILSTQNKKNSAFLKNRLQELVFPCFNEFGIPENHLQFTITFRNAH